MLSRVLSVKAPGMDCLQLRTACTPQPGGTAPPGSLVAGQLRELGGKGAPVLNEGLQVRGAAGRHSLELVFRAGKQQQQ